MKLKMLFVFIMFILISCTNSEDRIHKYTNIYFDIMIAREKFPDTSIGNKKVAEILKSYNYTLKDFQKESMELLMKDRTAFTKIIDSVRKRAEQEVNKINSEATKTKDTNQTKKLNKE